MDLGVMCAYPAAEARSARDTMKCQQPTAPRGIRGGSTRGSSGGSAESRLHHFLCWKNRTNYISLNLTFSICEMGVRHPVFSFRGPAAGTTGTRVRPCSRKEGSGRQAPGQGHVPGSRAHLSPSWPGDPAGGGSGQGRSPTEPGWRREPRSRNKAARWGARLWPEAPAPLRASGELSPLPPLSSLVLRCLNKSTRRRLHPRGPLCFPQSPYRPQLDSSTQS